jgi:hypothetical protein
MTLGGAKVLFVVEDSRFVYAPPHLGRGEDGDRGRRGPRLFDIVDRLSWTRAFGGSIRADAQRLRL